MVEIIWVKIDRACCGAVTVIYRVLILVVNYTQSKQVGSQATQRLFAAVKPLLQICTHCPVYAVEFKIYRELTPVQDLQSFAVEFAQVPQAESHGSQVPLILFAK